MIFLIDFENVGNNGFEGIEELNAEDKLIIFYSEKAKNLTITTHCKLESSNVQKEYFCVDVGGKNALDFQLVTYLGYLIATQNKETYFIVSKDDGYSFVSNFWKKRNIKIERCINLTAENYQVIEQKLGEVLTGHSESIKDIANIIMNYKTKQGINNALVKAYGSEKSGEIYKKIRPLIQNKKGR